MDAKSSGNVHVARAGVVLRWGELPGGCPGCDVACTARVCFVLGAESDRTLDRIVLLGARRDTTAPEAFTPGVFHVMLTIDERAWQELTADERTPGAVALRSFAASGAGQIAFPLTPAARLAVESIRRCPFGGACREMALTARCNDLLLEFLTTLAATAAARPVTLTASLEEHVRAAAAILVQNLESPPGVVELARRVGLSETTLKRGFHQVFGTTVFGYLRARRMERAHAALQSGEATVLEAAALVGYSNPSNFAVAFRRQFGVNPKTFQMAVRR